MIFEIWMVGIIIAILAVSAATVMTVFYFLNPSSYEIRETAQMLFIITLPSAFLPITIGIIVVAITILIIPSMVVAFCGKEKLASWVKGLLK